MALDLSILAPTGKVYVSFLRRYILKAYELIPRTSLRELSVALVGETRMSELHWMFMKVSGPTDVLSFPLELDSRRRVICGEVVVCVPQARRQARERRIPVGHELLLYVLHGMLHLSGRDDRTVAEFRSMHRIEDRILMQLGIGPIFAANAPTHSRPARRWGARR
jgi:probable rRNA maturation factor